MLHIQIKGYENRTVFSKFLAEHLLYNLCVCGLYVCVCLRVCDLKVEMYTQIPTYVFR